MRRTKPSIIDFQGGPKFVPLPAPNDDAFANPCGYQNDRIKRCFLAWGLPRKLGRKLGLARLVSLTAF
jgi:hypothetical protein